MKNLNTKCQEPTSCQINDVEQHVFPLHHIHRHMSEAHIVLHEVGHRNHGLDHLVHQQKLLSILQVSLSQVHVGARVDGAALWRWGGQRGKRLTDYINKSSELFGDEKLR